MRRKISLRGASSTALLLASVISAGTGGLLMVAVVGAAAYPNGSL